MASRTIRAIVALRNHSSQGRLPWRHAATIAPPVKAAPITTTAMAKLRWTACMGSEHTVGPFGVVTIPASPSGGVP